MKEGYLQVYTGNGKGKTTAAFGTAMRSVLHGGKVYFAQFIKAADTAELLVPEYFSSFTIEQFGNGYFIGSTPSEDDRATAKAGLAVCAEAMSSGEYDLVVMDEVNVAIYYGLLDPAEVIAAIESKSPGTEVICTGRNAPEELIEAADLVTEMRKVKHYFDCGVRAREGIEY
ncbi:MAG: cob(I)yrinic acid a,c-diamide adenosyltransferase [Methanomicrobiaceae archaeon]|nr:cob(I)yrinic acid a,c-diamide adenosyltransferase [Methanomicrobiaceae archaeon]